MIDRWRTWGEGVATQCGVFYNRLFSIHEIEKSTTVQWYFGAMLLFFYLTFSQWLNSSALRGFPVSEGTCWPYFQNCESLRFLIDLPHSYLQQTFYMVLFGIMVATVYYMWQKRWNTAHALLLLLFTFKVVASLLMNWGVAGVYDYYHLILTIILLFFPHKEYFGKVTFVFLYFLSATIKFHSSWLLGTYFTSLQIGLPLFPESLTVLLSQSVIISQIFGCWFLLSSNTWHQRLALIYFSIFHLYSGTLVGFNYPTIAETTLLILFGPLYRFQLPPINWRAVAGWTFLFLLLCLQLAAHFIPGDEKLTMEGYRFGMWMFDANHQCITTVTTYYKESDQVHREYHAAKSPGDGCSGRNAMCVTKTDIEKVGDQWVKTERIESPRSEVRCSPYTMWMQQKAHCDVAVERIEMQFDHAINGGPFYRIVDEPNICTLEYKAFRRNEWIKVPPEAPAIGIPVKNVYF